MRNKIFGIKFKSNHSGIILKSLLQIISPYARLSFQIQNERFYSVRVEGQRGF